MDQEHPAGGSLALGELIDEHGSALAHDLRAHYGLDLRDVVADLCSGRPTTSPWWLLALIEELPQGSAYVADLQGGRVHRDWTTDRYLLAALFDAVQINTVAVVRAGGGKAKAPKPVPRPGDKPDRSQGVPLSALMPSRVRPPRLPAKVPPSLRGRD